MPMHFVGKVANAISFSCVENITTTVSGAQKPGTPTANVSSLTAVHRIDHVYKNIIYVGI